MRVQLASESPGARRQRAYRERQKAARAVTSAPAPAAPAPVVEAPAASSAPAVTLHETEPVTASRDEWTATPTITPAAGGDATPIADVAAAEPARATSPEEAAVMAKAVAWYVGAGWSVLAARHRAELETFADSMLGQHPELGKLTSEQRLSLAFNGLVGVVEQATARLLVKYNVSFPYQDEAIVVVAIGTATFGMFGKKPAPNDNQRATSARNANAPSSSSAPATDAPVRADGRAADQGATGGGFEL